MAALGTVSLLDDPTLDCGLARLLVRLPKESAVVSYKTARLQISPESPFAICSFGGASSHAEAVRLGSVLLEEGLDMLAMSRAIDLATRDAADEYFTWWVDSSQKVIAAIDTATSTFSSKMTLSTSGPAGIPKPPQPALLHHPGLRFFRRSLVSEDLFDAFRNMYLAFELFLSSRYPKTQQYENEWLRDSLLAASGDVQLKDLAPPGHPAPVEFVIHAIYGGARLPLFHAKDGKTYFAPSPDERDRATVKAALAKLTIIVTRMAASWHGIQRPRTSVSSFAQDVMAKAPFANASFVASADARFSPEDPLSSPSTTSGIGFPAQIRDSFDGEQRINVWGAVDTAVLKGIGRVEIIHLVNAESPLASSAFGAPLNVDGFDRFQAIQFFRTHGVGEPRIFYPR
jgi:hypothetical protein